jgi:hypothetical protein
VPDKSFEYGGEMGLGLKTHVQCDLDDRQSTVPEQLLGAPNTLPQKKFVRPQTRRHPEQGSEVHPAQARNCCQIQQADPVRKVIVDVVDDPLEPPFLERRDSSAARLPVGRCIGCPKSGLQAGQPDRDGMLQGLDAIPVSFLLGGFEREREGDNAVIGSFGDRSFVPITKSGYIGVSACGHKRRSRTE